MKIYLVIYYYKYVENYLIITIFINKYQFVYYVIR